MGLRKLIVQERTNAGLKSARARGRLGGRPPLSQHDQRVLAVKRLYENNDISIGEACSRLKISRTTFYRYLKF